MSIYEFDAEQYARFLREEGAEEGRAEERLNTERERLNTEREKARADAAEARAEAAEARVKEAEQEIARLKAKL